MLRVSLVGNLGADPEVRYSPKGTQLVSFRVAVNQVRTGPDGERQENTEWFRIRVGPRQSEYVQRLNKGTRVLVIGRLDISHYTAKDGEPRTGFDVWADDVQAMTVRGGAEPYGAPGGIDNELDGPEPALAGVSSLSASGAAGAPRSNGNARRAARPSGGAEAPTAEQGPSEDLEDLPF